MIQLVLAEHSGPAKQFVATGCGVENY